MKNFACLCACLCGFLGVGCDWCVGVWFGEHAVGRVFCLVMRFSCLVSDFVIGGCSFVVVSLEGGWVIGQIVWASRW